MVREITPDPGGHRYLIKALAEAGNELAEELCAFPYRTVDVTDDDGWSARLIAAHVLAYEQMVVEYVQQILTRRNPELRVIDTEAVLDDPDARREEVERAMWRFEHLRHRLRSTLWELDDRNWDRTGRHPYRGPVSIVQLVRELHLHDLENLWRVRRLRDLVVVLRGGPPRAEGRG
jgi:hypothetical protein